MNNRLLLIAASLAAAFSSTPFAVRAANEVPLVLAEPPSEASLIGASTIAAPRALAVVSYRGAVARVSPSVVTVYSAHEKKGARGKASKTVVNGLGSGVVINRDGDIVTNYHVVEDATELEVGLVDGTVLPARVLGVDAECDIALLHVDATDLQPIAIADIEDVQPGDVALAIGNPLGIGQSVSQGIVSAVVRRGARPVENFIQTDASINPGNSGGALIDTAGRLMGINAVILSHSGGSEGIGFAIPVDLVQTVAASLKAHGRVARGRFGWAAIVVPRGEGAVVVVVDDDGPAHRAGIAPGDVVMRVGARPVHRTLDAANVVLGSDPGTHVAVEIVRHGVPTIVDIELAPVPASPAAL
jgi:S1-C subfamily serine protease